MPTSNVSGIRVKRVRIRETPSDDFLLLKKMNCNETLVYSASQLITYKVDVGTTYTEEIEYGASALEPTSFTPTKTGYTFVGWRTDTSASSSVLTEKNVDTEEFSLYAVFKKTITLSYNGNGSTGGSTAAQTGTKYYNNGTVKNPTFALASNGFSKTSYNFSKWALGSASGAQYAAGASVTLSADTTFYAVWTMKDYSTLFSNSDYHIGSNTGDKTGTFTCETPFNASNATKLQLVVSGYHKDTPNMNVYLLKSKTEAASSSNLVGSKNVPGWTTAGGDTTYEFDISKFGDTRYVHITTTGYLYIRSIKYV